MSLIGKKKNYIIVFFGFKKTVDTDEQVKLHSWKKLCNVCIGRKYWYWVIRIESATKEGKKGFGQQDKNSILFPIKYILKTNKVA